MIILVIIREEGENIENILSFLIRLRSRLKEPRFSLSFVGVAVIAGVHSWLEISGILTGAELLHLVPVSILLLPVIYAAINYGLLGSLSTAAVAVIFTLPNLGWHEPSERFGEIFQLVVVLGISIFAGQRVDIELRERRRVEEANLRLSQMAQKILLIQEQERSRIGQELHDSIGQSLTAVGLSLEAAKKSPPEKVKTSIEEAASMVRETIREVRDLAHALKPAALEKGLIKALEHAFKSIELRAGLHVRFSYSGVGGKLPKEVEINVLRIIQEALTNIARYAKTNEVAISLDARDGHIFLRIEDKGIGFELSAIKPDSLGIRGMKERAELFGGKLSVDTSPGAGTVITALLPLPKAEHQNRGKQGL